MTILLVCVRCSKWWKTLNFT